MKKPPGPWARRLSVGVSSVEDERVGDARGAEDGDDDVAAHDGDVGDLDIDTQVVQRVVQEVGQDIDVSVAQEVVQRVVDIDSDDIHIRVVEDADVLHHSLDDDVHQACRTGELADGRR